MCGEKEGAGKPAVRHLGQITALQVLLFWGRMRALGLDQLLGFL